MSTSAVLDTTGLSPEAAEEVRAFVERSRASVAHETERVDDDDDDEETGLEEDSDVDDELVILIECNKILLVVLKEAYMT